MIILPKNKPSHLKPKKHKCFNSKGYFCNDEPFSEEYLKIKHAVYQKFHPSYANDKQNVYEISKTPPIGYYIMKGYKHQTRCKSTQMNQQSLNHKSSHKIISNIVKQYLQRKQRIEEKQNSTLMLPNVKKISPIPKANQLSSLSIRLKTQTKQVKKNKNIRYSVRATIE